MAVIIRRDSLSKWRRRVTKGQRELVIKILRMYGSSTSTYNEKERQAFRIAAGLLEKLGDKD